MAAKRLKTSLNLQIQVQSGVDSKGDAKFATRNISSLKEDASNDNILAVGQAIAGVLSKETNGIYVSTKELVANA